jgi:hypothetical protein
MRERYPEQMENHTVGETKIVLVTSGTTQPCNRAHATAKQRAALATLELPVHPNAPPARVAVHHHVGKP